MTLEKIKEQLLKYRDIFGCLVCADSIKEKAAGVEDSAHHIGFLMAYMYFKYPECDIVNNFGVNAYFASTKKYVGGQLIADIDEVHRHPRTDIVTSADQVFPFLTGMYLQWSNLTEYSRDNTETAYRKLRRRLYRCRNGNFIPPHRLGALLRARHSSWYMYPIYWLCDITLIIYLLAVRAFPGRETLKIQPWIIIRTNEIHGNTIFNKIAKWLYTNMFDIAYIHTVYFNGAIIHCYPANGGCGRELHIPYAEIEEINNRGYYLCPYCGCKNPRGDVDWVPYNAPIHYLI